MFTSSWNAFGWVLLIAFVATITLPVLLGLGWLAYIKLTPAGRAWNAWWDSELTRLKTPRQPGTRARRLRIQSGSPDTGTRGALP